MPLFEIAARQQRPRRRAEGGLSLLELVIFIVVVSSALAAVLQVFLQAGASSADPMLRRQALAIAESMLEEVELMPFSFCDSDDPEVETATSTAGCTTLVDTLGPEAGENRYATPTFDNVNDYNGFTLPAGIVDITNTAVPGLSAYSVSVAVAAAPLHDIGAGSGDALRITVTVNGPAGTSVTLDGYRSRHAPNASL